MAAQGRRERWGVEERAELLARVRLFQQLPPATLKELAGHFRPRQVERDEFVFLEGEPAEALNLLATGRIKVVRETEDGREVILRLIGPGEIFGAAGGWGEPVYPASAVAQERGVVLQLPAHEFPALIAAHPDLAMAVIRELGHRLREAEARIRELQTERVERRIARVLVRLANKSGVRTAQGIEVQVPLSRQDLAEMAGTTLSTASRTLSAWHRQGIIAAGRVRVTILKPHALVAIAEDLPGPQEARD